MYRLTPQAKQGWHKSGWVRSDFVVDWDFVLRDVQNRNWLTFQMDFSLVIIQKPEKRVEMVLRWWTLEFHEVKFLRVFQNSINWLESHRIHWWIPPISKGPKAESVLCLYSWSWTFGSYCAGGLWMKQRGPKAFIFFLFSDGDFSSKPWGYLKGSQLNDGISTMSCWSQSF